MSNKNKIELEAAIMSQAQHQNNNWTYSIYVNDFRCKCKVELFIKQMLLTFDQLCKEKSFFSAHLCIWSYISNLTKTINVNG